MNQFVHLHLHTQFSLSEGAINIKSLGDFLEKKEFKACAITDHGNMHGAIQFYKHLKAKNIKPIIGLGAYYSENKAENTPDFEINLLCQNKVGYQNMIKLISLANNSGKDNGQPRIDFELIKKFYPGLIMLSGYQNSALYYYIKNNRLDQAKRFVELFKGLFDDNFYLEMQVDGSDQGNQINSELIKLSEEYEVTIVATNNCLYLEKEDAFAQHVLKLMGEQKKITDEACEEPYTNEFYIKSAEEMAIAFEQYDQRYLENTALLAERCDLDLSTDQIYLPGYELPEGITLEEQMKIDSHKGLEKRLQLLKTNYNWSEDEHDEKIELYKKRLDFELSIINKMGYPGYFLIVADFVNWAKINEISVGPGRGSGAGSLVAYSLGITGLDPIQFGLLFERFLNPERVSMPDFDIDFEAEKRDQVIEYVRQKYGDKNVCMISALGSYKAKAALRGVARVMNISLGEANRIANLVPKTVGTTLASTIETVPEFAAIVENGPEIFQNMIGLAQKIEGCNSNLSTHPAGVIIMDHDVSDVLPTCLSSSGDFIQSQYPMEDAENQGAVKFDFLGLKNLTIIEKALELINQTNNIKIDIDSINIFDAKPYELISSGRTMGIFQLESGGIKDLLKKLKPDCFEDWIAVIALYRPGPLGSGMIDDFVACKHKIKEPNYLHETLEEVLEETYGIMVYQEQIIKVVQILASYSLGEADMFRRAIGKKKESILLEQRVRFIDGCKQNDVDTALAEKIFELILKFAEYGFNKSHSAAYAMLGFQTAWLKSYYPLEFMTALLIVESANSDYISLVIEECKEYNIEIVAPDVKQSQVDFSTDGQKIYFGLSAIKNVSKAVVEGIIDERNKGQFKDIFDFFYRLDTTVSKRSIEFLIKSGSFDTLHPNRREIFENLDHYLSSIKTAQNNENENQISLFDMLDESQQKNLELSIDTQRYVDWDFLTKIFYEKEFLGSFFSGHPLDFYEKELKGKKITSIGKLLKTKNDGKIEKNNQFMTAGYISFLKVQLNKNHQRFAQFTIEDKEHKISGTFFAKQFAPVENQIKENDVVFLECFIMEHEEKRRIFYQHIESLSAKRQDAKRLKLTMNQKEHDIKKKIDDLLTLFKSVPGNCQVTLELMIDQNQSCEFEIAHKVQVSHNLIKALSSYFDQEHIAFEY